MNTIVYDGKVIPEWHAWLMETGMPLEPGEGWDNLQEIALWATSDVRRSIMDAPEKFLEYMLPEVNAVRSALIVAKLIAQGVNPYAEPVGQVEWITLAERELDRFPEKMDKALSWAKLRNVVTKVTIGGTSSYAVTDLGAEKLRAGLTPTEE